MGTYKIVGSTGLDVFLDSFFPAATRVEVSAVDGAVDVSWFRFGDPASHISLRLTGDDLAVSNGALVSGLIRNIDILIYDQTYLAGQLSDVDIDASLMQTAIDSYRPGTVTGPFPDLLRSQVQVVLGSDVVEEYRHFFPHVTTQIALLGGDDIYRHDQIVGPGGPSLILDGGHGFDSLVTGTQGRITVDFENDLFVDADGTNHTILNFESATGQDGGDVMIGALDRANRFDGGLGADFLQGGDRADWLRGGAGRDTIVGGDGDDLIFGDADNDNLDGGAGSDTVSFAQDRVKSAVSVDLGRGTATGFDTGIDRLSNIENIVGSGGDDTLRGDGGANLLDGRRGDDLLDGGAGSDTVTYAQAKSGVAVYLEFSGRDVGAGFGRDQFVSIESVIGSAFDDRLVGDNGFNRLTGGAGDDVLKGMGGPDRFDGGAGADRLVGGSDRDVMFGGEGEDVLAGLAGADVLAGGSGDDLIYGGRDHDEITGGRGADRLRGNLGNDDMTGGQEADDLRGGGGHDALSGDAGDDVLIGGNGQDVLRGGSGDDVLTGGVGAGSLDGMRDTFVYAEGGFDRIKDFEDGIDQIDLSGLGLTSLDDVAHETAAGLRLDFGDGDVLFIEGMRLVDFGASDLILG